jgi:hypothetical protein
VLNAAVKTVLVLKDGAISLWKNENTQVTRIDSQLVIQKYYTRIKEVTHIPYLVHAILQELSAKNASEIKDKLTKVKDKLNILLNEIDDTHANLILMKSIELLPLLMKNLDHPENLTTLMKRYLASLELVTQSNGEHATHNQLKDNLDKIVNQWIKKHNIDMLASRILIVGPHGPKEGSVEMQYWKAWYQNSLGLNHAENDKYYYIPLLSKHLQDVDIARDLIQEHLANEEMNKTVGVARHNNSKMMSRDLMERHGLTVLSKLFPPKKSQCPIAYVREKMKGLGL